MADEAAVKVLSDSALGTQVLDWQPLVGGVSASVHRLDYVAHDGRPASAVVRCHGDIDFARNSRLAADEFAIVTALHRAAYSVPEPLFLGLGDVPFGRPYAVYGFVDGELCSIPEQLAERTAPLAAKLAELHSLAVEDLEFELSASNQAHPRQSLRAAVRAADPEIFEPQIRALLGRVAAPSVAVNPVLLHGDFWWGNILWREDEIVAVLDWEDFGVGEAFADLACARLELLWAADDAAVESFTRHYLRLRGVTAQDGDLKRQLAWWDLAAVLPFAHTLGTMAAGEARRQMHQRLRGFVAAAFGVLGAELS